MIEKTANRVCTQVGELHHGGKLAVDEKRSFHHVLDVSRPSGSLPVKAPHLFRQAGRHRFVIVLHKESVDTADILQTGVESCHNLFERFIEIAGAAGKRAFICASAKSLASAHDPMRSAISLIHRPRSIFERCT